MKPTEAGNAKAELRRSYRNRRQQHRAVAEAGIQAGATTLAEQLDGRQQLGLYWPLKGEADLRQLADQPNLRDRLALPRVTGGQLRYRHWQPGAALSPDDTGIPAPEQGADLEASDLGLLLVPALAFDRSGFRLGYGGGWFDRLRSDPSWAEIPALAVLPAACLTESLPVEPWDVAFPGWLDERGIHWLQAV